MLVATTTAKREAIPEGVYSAIATRIIDLGDQYNKTFGNTSHKIMICFEIPAVTIDIDGVLMPKMISREFTLSLGKRSALRPFLESWRGKSFGDDELIGFDLRNILGKSCQIQIIHNDAGYERISSIMAMPTGTAELTPATELIFFDLSDVSCLEVFTLLPAWVQDKIKQSPQYQSRAYTTMDEKLLPF